jgi:hypothetical protein
MKNVDTGEYRDPETAEPDVSHGEQKPVEAGNQARICIDRIPVGLLMM